MPSFSYTTCIKQKCFLLTRVWEILPRLGNYSRQKARMFRPKLSPSQQNVPGQCRACQVHFPCLYTIIYSFSEMLLSFLQGSLRWLGTGQDRQSKVFLVIREEVSPLCLATTSVHGLRPILKTTNHFKLRIWLSQGF